MEVWLDRGRGLPYTIAGDGREQIPGIAAVPIAGKSGRVPDTGSAK
jgi:hypothetical protein